MEEIKELNTIEQIKAYSDPLRIKIIYELYNIGKPATVKQIADNLKLVPANVHYHVKKLEKAGILTLHHTEIINGIVAKYYEPAAKSFSINDKNIDSSVFKVLKSELGKTVQNLYNHSQEIFSDQILKLEKDNDGDKYKDDYDDMWVICRDAIYASPEEIKNLKDYLDDFFIKHLKPEKGSDIRKYHIFISTVTLEDKDRNDPNSHPRSIHIQRNNEKGPSH